MKTTFLDFEQPIAELEAKIEELRAGPEDSAAENAKEISRLQKKSQALTKMIYGKLTAWQIAQVARHPQRPYTLDYVTGIFTGFEELHGDRTFADDPAIGRPGQVRGTRELVIASYPFILVYRIVGSRIRVGRVLHQHQKYPD